MRLTRATDIDLVQRHAEFRGKVLLDHGARLVLRLEVLLEDIVLLFGEARLDIARRRLLGCVRPACILRRTGRVHGQRQAAKSDSLVSRDLGRMGDAQIVVTTLAVGVLEVAGGVQQGVLLRPGSGDNASGTVSRGAAARRGEAPRRYYAERVECYVDIRPDGVGSE
jgi:hypothetical protein